MAARLRASALFLVLGLGCSGSSPTQPTPPSFGEPFDLRPVLPGQLSFGVTMFVGNEIITNEGVGPPVCSTTPGRAHCYLSTAEVKTRATTAGHTIELKRLTPHPRAATPIQPGEYSATFVVSPR